MAASSSRLDEDLMPVRSSIDIRGNVILMGPTSLVEPDALAGLLGLAVVEAARLERRLPAGANLIHFAGLTDSQPAPPPTSLEPGPGPRSSLTAQFRTLTALTATIPLAETDIVIYGEVGWHEVHRVLRTDVIKMDALIRGIIEQHLNNIRSLYKQGCRRILFVHTGPENQSKDFREVLNFVIFGDRGLLKQLQRLKSELQQLTICLVPQPLVKEAALLADALRVAF